ncbi:MAG: hypothetical protein GX022_05600, partial [Clostridiaceae bacterium]|nr:hypothetical protein [Clostridiaceae bacterium]
MKKLLCILLSLLIVIANFSFMSNEVLAEGEPPVIIGDPSVLPVGPS